MNSIDGDTPHSFTEEKVKRGRGGSPKKKSSSPLDTAHRITLWAGIAGFVVFTICLIYSIADYNFDEFFPDCSFWVFFVSFAVFVAGIGASIVLSLCKKN